jgi:hypothetical protein
VVQTLGISQSELPSTPRTVTQITTQTTRVRSAGVQSSPRAQKPPTSSPSSSTSPDPTLGSILPRKIRSLCNIYNVETTNSFSLFSLFLQIDDPLTFE